MRKNGASNIALLELRWGGLVIVAGGMPVFVR